MHFKVLFFTIIIFLLMKNAVLSKSVINIGMLKRARIVSRPSRTIKSPYVADIILESDIQTDSISSYTEEGKSSLSASNSRAKENLHYKKVSDYLRSFGNIHLSHAPSLSCAGIVVPGSIVYVSKSKSSSSKTSFVIQCCEEARENGSTVIVGYHPQLAENAARAMLENNLLYTALGDTSQKEIKSQQTYHNSRVDFSLSSSTDDELILVEVKNVVGAEFVEGSVPSARSSVGVYTVPPPLSETSYKRHALFPLGTGTNTKPGLPVISDRAIKHITELTQLHGTSDFHTGKRIKCVLLFVVNRSDCDAFRPCHEADMLFARVLHRAFVRGVQLIAREIVWDGLKESMNDNPCSSNTEAGVCGVAKSGRELPVVFHPCVNEMDIDEELLAKVLMYNAEHGNTRSSPSKKEKPALSSVLVSADVGVRERTVSMPKVAKVKGAAKMSQIDSSDVAKMKKAVSMPKGAKGEGDSKMLQADSSSLVFTTENVLTQADRSENLEQKSCKHSKKKAKIVKHG